MSDLYTAARRTHSTAPRGTARTVGRWLVSFAGYPLGGYAAFLLTGRVDSLVPALAGGLLTGAALGAVQAWALGRTSPRPAAWVLATALGMAVGVATGAALVDYQTDLGSLILQGAVTGVLVGLAQATVLVPRLGRLALLWPVYLGGTFAIAWTVTTSAGIDVDQQFTIFGSSGALVATLLTAALPLVLHSRRLAD
jgi:hypothetical protein